MYDIEPLEKEWRRYKKKKMRPWYILFVIIFIIILIPVLFLNYNKIKFPEFSIKTNTKVNIDKSNIELLIDKPLSKLEIREVQVNDKSVDIAGFKSTVEMIQDKENIEIIVEDLPIPKNTLVLKKPKVNEQIKEKPRKKMHLKIIETSSITAYKDVEKRFKQSHDTDDSLFLAKSYYRKKNYKKAEYWALQTNKVNGNIEESLLIFVKSKVKLGHKNEAMQILTSYIKKSNSAEAKNLLYKIKKGML